MMQTSVREERRLQRQRGAATREVKNVGGFDIVFSGSDDVLLESQRPHKRRKTLQRDPLSAILSPPLQLSRHFGNKGTSLSSSKRGEYPADTGKEQQDLLVNGDIVSEIENGPPAKENETSSKLENDDESISASKAIKAQQIIAGSASSAPENGQMMETSRATISRQHGHNVRKSNKKPCSGNTERQTSANRASEGNPENFSISKAGAKSGTAAASCENKASTARPKDVAANEILQHLESMSDDLRAQLEEVTDQILAEDESQQMIEPQQDQTVEGKQSQVSVLEQKQKPKRRKKRRCIGQNYRPGYKRSAQASACASAKERMRQEYSSANASSRSPASENASSSRSVLLSQGSKQLSERQATAEESTSTKATVSRFEADTADAADPMVSITIYRPSPSPSQKPLSPSWTSTILPTDVLAQVSQEILHRLSAHPRLSEPARRIVMLYSEKLAEHLKDLGAHLATSIAFEKRVKKAEAEEAKLRSEIENVKREREKVRKKRDTLRRK